MRLSGGGQDQKLKCDYGNKTMEVSEDDSWKKGKEASKQEISTQK